jgi:hypothetical protein
MGTDEAPMSDRAHLLDRLLRLEQQLYETVQQRDDWKSIARRLRRQLLNERQAADGPKGRT